MIYEGQYMPDGQFIEWAWRTFQQGEEPQIATYIENICLSCGTVNVDEDHECSEGKQVA